MTGRRLLLGQFTREEDLLAATAHARRKGWTVADVHSPYPVHGLDEAMGIRPSRLGIACFLFGLTGFVLASLLQGWTHGVDWRINVGGRPFNAWPAYLPVSFEVMVLLAGTLTVLVFLVVSRLYPGKDARVLDTKATDGRFLLVIEAAGNASDPAPVLDLYRAHGAVEVGERQVYDPVPATPWHRMLRWALGAGLVLAVALNLVLSRDPGKPNDPFMPDMVDPVSYPSDSPNPDLPGGTTYQPPQEGTIPRGRLPLHYASTPEDAERAGRELQSPFRSDDLAVAQRGALVFSRSCAVCHGGDGRGNGPVTRRGVPPPPSLVDGKSASMPEGQLFHILTYGQGNMAAYAAELDVGDRWAVIRHVTGLQNRPGGAP